jgi:hypothetical protein
MPARKHDELHRIAVSIAFVFGLTLAAAAIAAAWPKLGPAGAPHPTLHGTLGESVSIFAHNLRGLAAPAVLVIARWHRARITRRLGDVVVAAIVLADMLSVGLALGKFQSRLLVYLPHLPFEWTALALSTCMWLAARQQCPERVVWRYAAAAAALLAVAALLETFAVPHVRAGV